MSALSWLNAPDGRYGVDPKSPLSAQAQTPSRPSGAGKEQQTTKNQGSSGPSRSGSPFDRIDIIANRHAILETP